MKRITTNCGIFQRAAAKKCTGGVVEKAHSDDRPMAQEAILGVLPRPNEFDRATLRGESVFGRATGRGEFELF